MLSKFKQLSFLSVCLASTIFPDLVFGIDSPSPLCENITQDGGMCNTKFLTTPGGNNDGFHFISLNNSTSKVSGKNVPDSLDVKGFLLYTNLSSGVTKTNFPPQSTYELTLTGMYEMKVPNKGLGRHDNINAIAPVSNLSIITGTGTLRSYGVNINELAIGMGNLFLSPLDADIKNSYAAPSSLTILQRDGDEDDSINFTKRLYVNNGSKISVDTDGEIHFRAKMQTSMLLPDIRFYDEAGEFQRELYQASLQDDNEINLNTPNSIGQNLELDFKASTFKNTGQLYISGARQSKDYSDTPLEMNLHSLNNIVLTAPPNSTNGSITYNFNNGELGNPQTSSAAWSVTVTREETYHTVDQMIDAFNNKSISGSDNNIIDFVDDQTWTEGRITVRDLAQLNIIGNVHNHGNGTIALFDGGVLSINGNFKNEGWIVSGAIDSRHFGYIDVKKSTTGVYNTPVEGTGKSILTDKTEFALMSRADNPLYGNRAYPILLSEGGISFIQNVFDQEYEEWDTVETEDVSKGLKKRNIHILSGSFENGSLKGVELAQNFSSQYISATPTLSADKKTLYISLSLTDEAKKKNINQLMAEADANLIIQKMITRHEKKVQTDTLEIKADEQKLGFLKDRVEMYGSLIKSADNLSNKQNEVQTALDGLKSAKDEIEAKMLEATRTYEEAIVTAQAVIDNSTSTYTEKYKAKQTIKTNQNSIEEWKRTNYYYTDTIEKYTHLKNKLEGLKDISTRLETEKTALNNLENPTVYHNSAKDAIQEGLIKAKGFYFRHTWNYAYDLLELLKVPNGYKELQASNEDGSVTVNGENYQAYYPTLIQTDFSNFDSEVFKLVEEKYKEHATTLSQTDFGSLVTTEELRTLNAIYDNYIESKVYFSKQKLEETLGEKFDDFSKAYTQKVLSLRKGLRETLHEFESQLGRTGVIESKKLEELRVFTDKIDINNTKRDFIDESYGDETGFVKYRYRLKKPAGLSEAELEQWKAYENKLTDIAPVFQACEIMSSNCVDREIQKALNEACITGTSCSDTLVTTFKIYRLSQAYIDLGDENAQLTRDKANFDDSKFDKAKIEEYSKHLARIEELLEIVKKGVADRASFVQEVLASILQSDETQDNGKKILNGLKGLEGIDVVVINHLSDPSTLNLIVSNVEEGLKTLSKTQSSNTAQKAISLVTSTLTSNRLAMLSNPVTPDVSLSELIQRMSKQRYVENEAGDVKTDVFLSLQEPQAIDKGKNMQLWGSVIGGYASADGNSSIYGGSVGYDTFIGNNWILGGYATYAYVSSKAKGDEITNNSHNAQLGLYSRVIMGEANELDIFVSHNVGFVHQDRDMKILDIYKQKSDYVSQSSDIGLKYGYVFGIGKDKQTFFIKPYVGGDLLINVLGKYKEKGLAFEQEGQTNSQVNVGVGLELRKYFKDGGFFFITPGVDARVYDSQNNMVYKLGGQEIISDIVKKTDVYFIAIVGGEFKMTQSLFGFGSLGAKVNGDENYFNGTIGVRYKF